MPHYTTSIELSRPVGDVFAYLSATKNLVKLAPEDLNLELLSAPAVLTLGAVLTWKGRRWGISQQIIQEVAELELDKRITIKQTKGPFAKWVHAHQFAATEAGTLLHDKIDFEPPGGMLGLMVNANSILKDLEKLFAHRQKKLAEIFA